MADGDRKNSVKEFLAPYIVTEAAPAAVDEGNITATLTPAGRTSFLCSLRPWDLSVMPAVSMD